MRVCRANDYAEWRRELFEGRNLHLQDNTSANETRRQTSLTSECVRKTYYNFYTANSLSLYVSRKSSLRTFVSFGDAVVCLWDNVNSELQTLLSKCTKYISLFDTLVKATDGRWFSMSRVSTITWCYRSRSDHRACSVTWYDALRLDMCLSQSESFSFYFVPFTLFRPRATLNGELSWNISRIRANRHFERHSGGQTVPVASFNFHSTVRCRVALGNSRADCC